MLNVVALSVAFYLF